MAQYNVHIYYETRGLLGIHKEHIRDWKYDHNHTPEEIYLEIEQDLKNIGLDSCDICQETVSTTVVQEPDENQ